MVDARTETARFLEHVPDVPRWVEARSMLLSGGGAVLAVSPGGQSLAVRSADRRLMCVVGRPEPAVLRREISDLDPRAVILAGRESAGVVRDAVPEWLQEEAMIHRIGPWRAFPPIALDSVRLLRTGEPAELVELPDDLRADLVSAGAAGPVAAAFDAGRPVSFCYAEALTETLWDVSIDTLPAYRRRGHAARAVSFLFDLFARGGKQPVWGALRSNLASLRLAGKLGFVEVDRLLVFQAPRSRV